jgi:hypothetical protein
MLLTDSSQCAQSLIGLCGTGKRSGDIRLKNYYGTSRSVT